MHIPKNYFHDKMILLLGSVNVFLAAACTLLVLLRVGVGQGSNGYIAQYRANLGISRFKTGDVADLLSFIAFALIILAFNVILSMRTYHLRRELSLVVLGLGALLLLLATIVSNALLVLR
ncbi:MAG TPA: hypothetical protein VHT70_03205 [Candidatus Saccharimonadales bacterium]|jgi:hypothetical protein|nr:hypothetical protein [Candidatus Saccharimonadales bacterium]